MLSLSSLVQFLMELLRNGDVAQDFARDPRSTLADHGLSGVTAQDVKDVLPLLADQPGVTQCGIGDVATRHSSSHGSSHGSSHHDDPVQTIHHVQHNYQSDHHSAPQYHAPAPVYTEYHDTYKTYVTYDSSVHADHGGTVVKDSFNTHNGGVDNTGGTIVDSTVGGSTVAGSGNDTKVTAVTDSFDDDHSKAAVDSANQTTTGTVTDSANHADTSVVDSGNTEHSTHVNGDVLADNSVNGTYGSYSVHEPDPVVAGHEVAGSEHALV